MRSSCCCRGLFPCPAELGAANPDAVHDHSQSAGQRHNRLFHPAAPGQRTVVVEYSSLETAIAAYDSPAYVEALKALGDGALRDFRIVEGVE